MSGVPQVWFRNGLALVAGAWIGVSALFGWRLARLLRVAMLLPILHVIMILIGWRVWTLVTPSDGVSVAHGSSLGFLVVALAAACGGGGWLVARRRRREVTHATVMVALAFLLLLGLWLPIVCRAWCHPVGSNWPRGAVARPIPLELIAVVLLPPLACSIAFVAAALRWPALVQRYRMALFVASG